MSNIIKKECGVGMYWCETDNKCKPLQEDGESVANNVGSGKVAGLGVGVNGEPGIKKKKGVTPFISFIKRKTNVAS